MGRSENSRNRRFVADGGALRTEPVDAGRLADPSLVIYDAMLELPGVYLVSNGDQTRTLRDALAAGGRFEDALATREREPDAPHYTPRISGMLDLRGAAPALALSILRASVGDPAQTDRTTFRPAPPPPGFALGLTTYAGDGDPLPSFRGDPLWLPLEGTAEQVLERYWDALDRSNRISLAVKRIPASAGGAGGRLDAPRPQPARLGRGGRGSHRRRRRRGQHPRDGRLRAAQGGLRGRHLSRTARRPGARSSERLPDLAMLDILMPRMDGLELCRRLRGRSEELPILFLTSRDEEFDRVLGLELGADDYLCKPFSMRELLARVKVLFRRAALPPRAPPAPRALLVVGDLRLDLRPLRGALAAARWSAHRHRVPHPARPGAPPRPRQDPRRSSWSEGYPDDAFVSDRTIDSHVKRLRRKLEAADPALDAIETVYGLGYRSASPEPRLPPEPWRAAASRGSAVAPARVQRAAGLPAGRRPLPLGTYERQLLDAQERAMVQQGRLLAAALAERAADRPRPTPGAILVRLERRSRPRACAWSTRAGRCSPTRAASGRGASRGAEPDEAARRAGRAGSTARARRRSALASQAGAAPRATSAAAPDDGTTPANGPLDAPEVAGRARRPLRRGHAPRAPGQRSLTLYSAHSGPRRRPRRRRRAGLAVDARACCTTSTTVRLAILRVFLAASRRRRCSRSSRRPRSRARSRACAPRRRRSSTGAAGCAAASAARPGATRSATSRARSKSSRSASPRAVGVRSSPSRPTSPTTSRTRWRRSAAASELLAATDDPAERARYLAIVARDVARLERLLGGRAGARPGRRRARGRGARGRRPSRDLLGGLVEASGSASASACASRSRRRRSTGSRAAAPGRLAEAFENLIDNAVSFSPPGGEVRVAAPARGRTAVVDRRATTGPGIPAEHLDASSTASSPGGPARTVRASSTPASACRSPAPSSRATGARSGPAARTAGAPASSSTALRRGIRRGALARSVNDGESRGWPRPCAEVTGRCRDRGGSGKTCAGSQRPKRRDGFDGLWSSAAEQVARFCGFSLTGPRRPSIKSPRG